MRAWPARSVAAIAIGLLIMAAPASMEGPELLRVGQGHALSGLDGAGLLVLLSGLGDALIGLWLRRTALSSAAARSPSRAGLLLFAAGLGAGLLIASGLSLFFWWWALGALLLAVALGAALAVALRVDAISRR